MALGALVTYHALFFSAASVLRHLTFGTSAYDVGLFDQTVWLLSRGETPFTTIKGVHVWGDHASLCLLLYVPFMRLFDSVNVLYIGQSVLLALAAVPVFLFANRALQSPGAALVAAAAYLLHPALQNMNLENFHPETYAVLPLLWALYFLEIGQLSRFAVACGLALLAKEDVSISVFALGVFAAAVLGHRRVGLTTAGMALAWYLMMTRLLMPYLNGIPITAAQPLVYSYWFAEIWDKLLSPPRLMSILTAPESVRYCLELALPLGLLPLLSPRYLLLCLPPVLINVLSESGYLRSTGFHYNYCTLPFLCFGAIAGLARLLQWAKTEGVPGMARALPASLLLVASIAGNLGLSQSPLPRQWSQVSGSLHRLRGAGVQERRRALGVVPEDATVSASHTLLPHLLHRKEAYMFPNPFFLTLWNMHFQQGLAPRLDGKDMEYVILDRSLPEDRESRLLERYLVRSGNFEEIFEDQQTRILRRARLPGEFPAGIRYATDGPGARRSGAIALLAFPANAYYLRDPLHGIVVRGPATVSFEASLPAWIPEGSQIRIEATGEGRLRAGDDDVFFDRMLRAPLPTRAGHLSFRLDFTTAIPPFGLMVTVIDPGGSEELFDPRLLAGGN